MNSTSSHLLKLSRFPLIFLLLLVFGSSGCRTSYYSVMEKLGKPKRTLLKSSLENASVEQVEANEQFKEALVKLKEIYGFEGGDIESRYEDFKSEYERSVRQADAVRKRVAEVNQVGTDLFSEWREEIEEISSPNLKSASEEKLGETELRFTNLMTSLRKSEETMEPVLSQMKDYVLFLKHNLNAMAMGTLKEEAGAIEKDILRLISDMNQSISDTEVFIHSLESEE